MRLSSLFVAANLLVSPAFVGMVSPTFVEMVRAESRSSTSEQSQAIRVIEAEGQGHTTLEARKSAVAAAIEQAIGVYVDSRRRSEMQLSDKKLHELIEDKVQTYSSAFVEKVETLSSNPDGQGGFIVRLRCYVVVSELLNAMKEADIPFAAVDLTSIQTKFDTQAQKQQDAAELLATELKDLPRAIRIEIVTGSIKAGLSDVDPNMAILNGKLSITFDTRGLKRVFDMFNTYTDVQSPSGRSNSGSAPPRKAFVCLSNLLGEITCRGEQINFAGVAEQFHDMYIKVSLRYGNEKLGSIRALVNFNCGGHEQRFRWEPAYFEATTYYDPDSLEFKPNPEWGYLDDASRDKYVGADFEHSSIDELNWARKNRETRLLTLRITDVRVEAGTTEETRAAELRARMPAQSLCSFYDQQQGWRLLISSGSAPLTRYFYIVAPKEILSQVDKIGFSAEAE